MSVSNRYHAADSSEESRVEGKPFNCPHYTPLDGKHCKDYREGGNCFRSGMKCSEWLKVNPSTLLTISFTPAQPGSETNQAEAPQEQLDSAMQENLFDGAEPVTPSQKRNPKTRLTPEQASYAKSKEKEKEKEQMDVLLPPPGMTDEHIESFKRLRAEVCIDTKYCGPVWLVPEYTGQSRKELTPEHYATLWHVTELFPGASLTSFEIQSQTNENKEKDA